MKTISITIANQNVARVRAALADAGVRAAHTINEGITTLIVLQADSATARHTVNAELAR